MIYKAVDILKGTDLREQIDDKPKLSSLLVANGITTLAFLVCAIASLIVFFINQTPLLIFFGSYFFVYFGIFLLLRTRFQTSAKLLLYLAIDSGVFVLSDLLGAESLMQMMFLLLLCFPFFFFPLEQKWLINGSMLLPIVSFYILESQKYSFFAPVVIEEDSFMALKIGLWLTAFIANWMILDIFSKNRAEKEIIENLLFAEQKLNSQLSKAKTKAEMASKAKSDFLAVMSHEFRTPINGIFGATSLLKEGEIDAEDQECLDIVQSSAENLLQMVNDILDYTRMDAGDVSLDSKVLDLSQIANDAYALLQESFKRQNLTFSLTADPNIPKILFGDGAKLRQILLNLYSNSIKFARNSRVETHLRFEGMTEADKAKVVFEVRDYGGGIPPHKMSIIFDAFLQADNSYTRGAEGIGLGLALCKKLVTLMGGRISAFSDFEEGGTLISFDVLLEIPDSKFQTSFLPPEKEGSFNILFLEENPVNQKVAMGMLERLHHNVTLVESVGQTIEALSQIQYDLVLLDYTLSQRDGATCLKNIRMLPDTTKANVPIVVLMNANALDQQKEVLELGANDVMVKPINKIKLEDMLSNIKK